MIAQAKMPQDSSQTMDAITRRRLSQIADDATHEEKLVLKRALGLAASAARSVAGHWAFEAPAKAINQWISGMLPEYTDEALTRVRKVAVDLPWLVRFEKREDS